MPDPTNVDRADTVAEAVGDFAVAARMTDEDDETILADFICNVLHYANQCGVDVDYLIEHARRHFDAEVCCCNTNPGECPEHEPPESFL